MKKPSLIVLPILFLVYCSPLICQDFSNFYNVSGFHLSPLKSQQYLISLTPTYQNSISKYSNSSSALTDSYLSKNESPQELFLARTYFLYGLSNETTVSLNISYSPKQSSGKLISSYKNTYNSGANIYNSNSVYDPTYENLNSSFVIAHRPRSNVEVSLEGYYYSYNTPQSGTSTITQTNPNSTTTNVFSSTNKQMTYSISLGLVILGN